MSRYDARSVQVVVDPQNDVSEGIFRANRVEGVVVLARAPDYCVKGAVLDAVRPGFRAELIGTAVAAANLADGDDNRAPGETFRGHTASVA